MDLQLIDAPVGGFRGYDPSYSPTQNGLADNLRQPSRPWPGRDGRVLDVGGENWFRLRRPYYDSMDRPAVTINTGRTTLVKGERKPILEGVLLFDVVNNYGLTDPVFNATSLRKEEWLELDQRINTAYRYRLKLWTDIAAASPVGGFNGLAKTVLEYETMTDPGRALQDMDGVAEASDDAPLFQLQGTPLPITHSGFRATHRKLEISRAGRTPVDMVMAEACGTRIGERVEKMTIGNIPLLNYGGQSTMTGGYGRVSSTYGCLNFTARLTKANFTQPGLAAWTPEVTQQDFNLALNQLRLNKSYGPFMVYHSPDWQPWLDGDYYVARTSGAVAPNMTLRNRLKQLPDIIDIKRLDMLFSTIPDPNTASASHRGPGGEDVSTAYPWTLIFLDINNRQVVEAIIGLGLTTIQWQMQGGLQLCFRSMCINVPRLKADHYGNVGLLHGSTA